MRGKETLDRKSHHITTTPSFFFATSPTTA